MPIDNFNRCGVSFDRAENRVERLKNFADPIFEHSHQVSFQSFPTISDPHCTRLSTLQSECKSYVNH